MAGKGDKMRPTNKRKFDENYSQINWSKNNKSNKFCKNCGDLLASEEEYCVICKEMFDSVSKIGDNHVIEEDLKQTTEFINDRCCGGGCSCHKE